MINNLSNILNIFNIIKIIMTSIIYFNPTNKNTIEENKFENDVESQFNHIYPCLYPYFSLNDKYDMLLKLMDSHQISSISKQCFKTVLKAYSNFTHKKIKYYILFIMYNDNNIITTSDMISFNGYFIIHEGVYKNNNCINKLDVKSFNCLSFLPDTACENETFTKIGDRITIKSYKYDNWIRRKFFLIFVNDKKLIHILFLIKDLVRYICKFI